MGDEEIVRTPEDVDGGRNATQIVRRRFGLSVNLQIAAAAVIVRNKSLSCNQIHNDVIISMPVIQHDANQSNRNCDSARSGPTCGRKFRPGNVR